MVVLGAMATMEEIADMTTDQVKEYLKSLEDKNKEWGKILESDEVNRHKTPTSDRKNVGENLKIREERIRGEF